MSWKSGNLFGCIVDTLFIVPLKQSDWRLCV